MHEHAAKQAIRNEINRGINTPDMIVVIIAVFSYIIRRGVFLVSPVCLTTEWTSLSSYMYKSSLMARFDINRVV